MGMDLEYRCGDLAEEWRISGVVFEVFDKLRAALPAEVETLVGVPQLGDEVEVRVEAVRGAVERVRGFLDANPAIMPRMWQMRSWYESMPKVPGSDVGFSCGGRSGLRLVGDPEHSYSLEAGLGGCTLEKWGFRPDGRGESRGKRPVQEGELIRTTDSEVFEFRTRPAGRGVTAMLREMAAFAERCSGPTIVKSIT